jgi:serine/threonine protein phosphatase PrpC
MTRTINPDYELTGGGVLGRDHRVTFRNYQDALHILQATDCTVAVVADGCGSALHSETGAQLGVRLLAEIVCNQTRRGNVRAIKWRRVLQHLLSSLDTLARQMGGNYREVVEEFFLFTCIGVVLGKSDAVFFGLGDGLLVINGEATSLGPYPGNMPPYAGYGLLEGSINIDPALLDIWTCEVPLAELDHFLIGTDGLDDLMEAAEKSVPGMDQPVGGIEQFWTEDRYFGGNPELVSRRLRLLARDWPKHNPEPGVLPDDTSLIVGRRRQTDH